MNEKLNDALRAMFKKQMMSHNEIQTNRWETDVLLTLYSTYNLNFQVVPHISIKHQL